MSPHRQFNPVAQMCFSHAGTPIQLHFTAVLGWDEPMGSSRQPGAPGPHHHPLTLRAVVKGLLWRAKGHTGKWKAWGTHTTGRHSQSFHPLSPMIKSWLPCWCKFQHQNGLENKNRKLCWLQGTKEPLAQPI